MNLPNKNIIFLIVLFFSFLSFSCEVEQKSQNFNKINLFNEKNFYLFEGKPVKLFIDSLVHVKGMPQRIHSFTFANPWPPQPLSYNFDYVYSDSTFCISVWGKRSVIDWKNGDLNFKWAETEVMAEIPLYMFEQDTVLKITIGKYKTVKEKYAKALRENKTYVDKSLYEAWVDRVGKDSVEKILEKRVVLPRLP